MCSQFLREKQSCSLFGTTFPHHIKQGKLHDPTTPFIIMPSMLASRLSRELDVSFIDARNIAAEARVALDIEGYPTADQVSKIVDEAHRIFQNMPREEQKRLRIKNMELQAIKSSCSSLSSLESQMESLASASSPSPRRLFFQR